MKAKPKMLAKQTIGKGSATSLINGASPVTARPINLQNPIAVVRFSMGNMRLSEKLA